MMSHRPPQDSFGLTHTGKVRSVNQDQFLIASMHKTLDIEHTSVPDAERILSHGGTMARLLLVADGVGGSVAGERASGLAVTAVASYVGQTMKCFYNVDLEHRDDILTELASLARQSHEAVLSAARENAADAGMATTLTVAHILWPRAYIVQVGDSRCYHKRGSTLTQITKDQTVAQGLLDSGHLTPEEAEQSPFGDVLSSAVGMDISPVTTKLDLEVGDTLLLCSDGLTKHVDAPHMLECLTTAGSAESACRRLVDAALRGGGSDNITVVVSRFL